MMGATTEPEQDSSSPMTMTERLDHVSDRLQLCLAQAQEITIKSFGVRPIEEVKVQELDVTNCLSDSIENVRILAEERLLVLLQEINQRL